MKATDRIYVDSSVVLALLLREKRKQDLPFTKRTWVSSELTELECRRTLDRIRLHERLPDDELAERLVELDLILRAMNMVQLNTAILQRAKSPYPTTVRSLDAIHLATAELAKIPEFATFDRQQATAATAIGLKTFG